MADHKAIQVLDAVVTLLTGLATTGANIKKSRAYAVQTTPAITVGLGAETVRQFLPAFIDRELNIEIDIHVKATETTLDNSIQQVRKEIFIALMADPKIGLDFVIEIEPVSTAEAVINSDSEYPTALVSETWRVIYRHSITDASE